MSEAGNPSGEPVADAASTASSPGSNEVAAPDPAADAAPDAGAGKAAARPGRRRRPQVSPPTQQELDALPVKDRLELLEHARARKHQRVNSIVLLFGVMFTAAGLIATR